MLEALIDRFIKQKHYQPSHANELLDLLQREYILGSITIVEYRNVYRELNERGASKPS
ncbi:hypothetical protein J2S74_004097 [Evansella vedderi]|uniref:YppF-like protein n=1 Tax=Evansella vedderi TaxID=38282 RepID=A0ABU0A2V1_9BACI|nr:YppF family protein [Evansella vedderi]MDQ0256675.1 hypothetical protein [Evansella vedderi]